MPAAISRREFVVKSTESGHVRAAALLLAATLVPVVATPAVAQELAAAPAEREYAIPAGPLSTALSRFAAEAGVLLSVDAELTRGKSSPGLQGRHSVGEGFRELLKGTGLVTVPDASGSGFRLEQAPEPVAQLPAVPVISTVSVPGQPLPDYKGGQVGSGAGLGVLGQRGFLDTPFNVVSYTATLMQDQQAQSVADVVANDPSVRSVFQRGSYIDHFTVRGFRVANNNLGFGGLYGILPSQVAPIEGVERVEVLKGANTFIGGAAPQGEANISGNINLVPKRAGSEPLTELTASYESDSLLGTHLDVGRRFGEDQRYGLRVNAVLRDGNTAIDNHEQRLGQLTAAFDARFDGLRLSADLGYLKLKGGSQPYSVDVAAGLPIPRAPDASRNYNQPWEYVEVEGTVYGMTRIEADLPLGMTAYAAAGGRDESMEFLYTNPQVIDTVGTFDAAPYALPWYEKALSGEVGLRGNVSTGPVSHQWNVGVTRLDLRRGLRFAVPGPGFQSNLYAPVDQPKPNLAGIYADPHKTFDAVLTSYVVSDTLHVLEDRLQLTLGARIQKIDVANFSALTGAQGARYTDDKITPAAGILFKPRENLSLYLNYVEGLSQGPVAPNDATNGGEVFEPYVAKQYEAGLKVDWGGWATTIGVFELRQPQELDVPVVPPPAAGLPNYTFTVDGEQRVRGIEFQVFGEPRKGLRTIGGLTLMDGEQVKTEGGLLNGKTAPGVPDVQANLNLEWDVPALVGFTIWQRTLYTASQYLDKENTQKLPDWTRLDAGVRHRFTRSEGRDLVLRASVENLLDKDYWVSSARSLTLSSPRTLLVSATYDF